MILSIPSSTKLCTCSTAPRVSAPHSVPRVSFSVKSGYAAARRRSRTFSPLFFSSNMWGVAEMLDDKKSSSSSVAAAAAVVASNSASNQHDLSPPRTFLDARTEQDLLLVIRKEVEAGRLPVNVAQGMEELYHNYRNAVK